MKERKPVVLWCKACQVGYASTGEVPLTCPNERCRTPVPHWTTTPPYKPTVNDQRFLRSIKIDPA